MPKDTSLFYYGSIFRHTLTRAPLYCKIIAEITRGESGLRANHERRITCRGLRFTVSGVSDAP